MSIYCEMKKNKIKKKNYKKAEKNNIHTTHQSTTNMKKLLK